MGTIRKEGSTYPSIKCNLPNYTADELAAIDNVGFRMQGPSGLLEGATVRDGLSYRYDFPVDLVVGAGVYSLRIVVTFVDGRVEILPSSGEEFMRVEE